MFKILYLTNIFEIIAAILSVVYLKKYINSTEKYFVVFLWITVLVDLIGSVFYTYLKQNVSGYTFYIYSLVSYFTFTGIIQF